MGGEYEKLIGLSPQTNAGRRSFVYTTQPLQVTYSLLGTEGVIPPPIPIEIHAGRTKAIHSRIACLISAMSLRVGLQLNLSGIRD